MSIRGRLAVPGILEVMLKQRQIAISEAADWLGDWHPLAEQLGSAKGLVTLASLAAELRLPPVRDVAGLRHFLFQHQKQVLIAFELPAVQAAHQHASLNELRELVALDTQMIQEPALRIYAAPSRRVGQAQLKKLQPLRDQRFVQRYLHAVEAGAAQGWHTLVYGLTLSVYSLPLRQGLLGYAHETSRGFIYGAANALRLSERACRRLFDEVVADLPAAVESLIQYRAVA